MLNKSDINTQYNSVHSKMISYLLQIQLTHKKNNREKSSELLRICLNELRKTSQIEKITMRLIVVITIIICQYFASVGAEIDQIGLIVRNATNERLNGVYVFPNSFLLSLIVLCRYICATSRACNSLHNGYQISSSSVFTSSGVQVSAKIYRASLLMMKAIRKSGI